MRKVPLNLITPDMQLGKAVCRGASVLIREGTRGLDRFIPRLNKMGVGSIYIEDAASEGIEIDDLIQDQTKMVCKRTLEDSFKKMKGEFAVDQRMLSEAAGCMLDDIMCRPNVLASLNDIGSIEDNTLDHSINTTIYALCLAMQLGYDRYRLMDLAQGTLLHDVGKTALDSNILFKPGKLTSEEFEHIKCHSLLGYEILNKSNTITEPAKRISLCHHERLDGSGYPYGITGGEIPEMARIAAIVDVYEAMTVDRCYRKAYTPQRALEILAGEAVSKLDINLVSVFMQNIAIYPTGTGVKLSDGRLAVVKAQNPSMPMRPLVRVIELQNGKTVPGEEIDLMDVLNLTIVEE